MLPKNPPTKAPIMPKTIEPKIPPLDGLGSTILAIEPAIKPNTIQDNILKTSSPPFNYVSSVQFVSKDYRQGMVRRM